jgi:dihydroorotase
LNLHGEVLESLAPPDTTLEEAFLPTLKKLHERFPALRIVVSIFDISKRLSLISIA